MYDGGFELVSPIQGVEVFASGHGIRDLPRLRKHYGPGFWRKCKGFAKVRLSDGRPYLAELHWYEATGIGRREMKIKHILKPL